MRTLENLLDRCAALIFLAAILSVTGCDACHRREYVTVHELVLHEGQGGIEIPVAPHAGVNIGRSVYVTGLVTNEHSTRTAVNIDLVVRLYRRSGDNKARHEYTLHNVKGLDRIGPGATIPFTAYLKDTLRGYERVDGSVIHAELEP